MSTRTGASWRFVLPAAACLLLLMLASCSDDPVAAKNTGELNNFVNSLGTFADPPPGNTGAHVLKASHSEENTEPGVGRFVCEVKEYRMDKNLHETTVFNVNDVSLWPGALVRGGDLDLGQLNPVVVGRAPVTVGTDLSGLTQEQGTRTVSDPNHLKVGGAVNEIVNAYLAGPGAGTIGARLSFDETYVEEFNQSMLDLSVSMSWSGWGSGSLQTDFAASHEDYTTSYLCRFSQAYFTASVVPPGSPSDMFADGVEVSDLGGYMNANDPPCYVSSVTYGRVGFLSIHSYAQRDSVAMAVKAAFSGWGFDTEGELNAAFENILNRSEIKIMVRGGAASDGVLPIIGDRVDGLYDWIVGGAGMDEASDAVPISYTARYLKDNRPAAFAYANEWTTETCSPATMLWQVAVPRISCASADDGLWDYTLEIYYTFNLQYQTSPTAPIVTETIFSRPEANTIGIGGGGNHYIPEAVRTLWMPEQAGAQFRLQIFVADYDAGSGNDQIGNFTTDWYTWPDWRSAGGCTFPAGFPVAGGEPGECSRPMLDDSGSNLTAYWNLRLLTPPK